MKLYVMDLEQEEIDTLYAIVYTELIKIQGEMTQEFLDGHVSRAIEMERNVKCVQSIKDKMFKKEEEGV